MGCVVELQHTWVRTRTFSSAFCTKYRRASEQTHLSPEASNVAPRASQSSRTFAHAAPVASDIEHEHPDEDQMHSPMKTRPGGEV